MYYGHSSNYITAKATPGVAFAVCGISLFYYHFGGCGTGGYDVHTCGKICGELPVGGNAAFKDKASVGCCYGYGGACCAFDGQLLAVACDGCVRSADIADASCYVNNDFRART